LVTHLPVRFRQIDRPGMQFFATLTKDLSTGGFKVTVDNFMSCFSNFIADLNLSTQKNIRTISKVAWIRKMPYADRYEAGLKFVFIDDSDKTAIEHYVNKGLSNPESVVL